MLGNHVLCTCINIDIHECLYPYLHTNIITHINANVTLSVCIGIKEGNYVILNSFLKTKNTIGEKKNCVRGISGTPQNFEMTFSLIGR